jgi:hypothetical protein
MATTAVASVAAISGLAAYLNGKYHIKQDVKILKFRRDAAKYYAELGTSPLPPPNSRTIKSNSKLISKIKTPIPLVLLHAARHRLLL